MNDETYETVKFDPDASRVMLIGGHVFRPQDSDDFWGCDYCDQVLPAGVGTVKMPCPGDSGRVDGDQDT